MDFKGERIREVSLRSCSCNCEELTSLHQEGEGGRERGREAAGRQAGRQAGRRTAAAGGRRKKKKERRRKGRHPFLSRSLANRRPAKKRAVAVG